MHTSHTHSPLSAPPAPGRPLHASPVQGFTGIDIEALFARRPDGQDQTHVFCPFPAETYAQLQGALRRDPRIKEVAIPEETMAPLLRMPPKFRERFEPQEQIDYDVQFAQASYRTASLLLAEVTRGLEGAPSTACCVWRAGLCFADAPLGVDVCHLGLKRDPQTLQSHSYYERWNSSQYGRETHLFLCDPMIGTGNAMITALEAALRGPAKDLPHSQIHVVGIFVTPEAAARVRNRFPEISIHGASFDSRLNERGWIIPNKPDHFLGDFGDCFAPAGLSNEHISTLVGKKALTAEDVAALFKRMQQA